MMLATPGLNCSMLAFLPLSTTLLEACCSSLHTSGGRRARAICWGTGTSMRLINRRRARELWVRESGGLRLRTDLQVGPNGPCFKFDVTSNVPVMLQMPFWTTLSMLAPLLCSYGQSLSATDGRDAMLLARSIRTP
jgi:hypothetical protein